jgi:hypothetical protein
MTILHDLTHRKARSAQVGLSYFFLTGFFIITVMEGLGRFKISLLNQMIPITMLVMSFWFQRQRSSTDEADELKRGPDPVVPPKTPEPAPINPIQPPQAADLTTNKP